MALKKPKKCVGDCNDFVCFGKGFACAAIKLVAIGDSRSAHSEGCEKCAGKNLNSFVGVLSTRGKKKHSNCFKVSRDVVDRNVNFLVEPFCLNVIAPCI